MSRSSFEKECCLRDQPLAFTFEGRQTAVSTCVNIKNILERPCDKFQDLKRTQSAAVTTEGLLLRFFDTSSLFAAIHFSTCTAPCQMTLSAPTVGTFVRQFCLTPCGKVDCQICTIVSNSNR